MKTALNIKLSLELFHEVTNESLFGPVEREYVLTPEHDINDITEYELKFIAEKIFCTRLINKFKDNPDLKAKLTDKPWKVRSTLISVKYISE